MHPELKETAPDIPLLRQALLRQAYDFAPQFITNDSVATKIGRVTRLLHEAIERESQFIDGMSHRHELEEQLVNLQKFEKKKIQGKEDVDRMREASRECLSRLTADTALSMVMDEKGADAPPEDIIEGSVQFLSITENRLTIEAGLTYFRDQNPSAVVERDTGLLMTMAADLLRKEVSLKY